MTTIQLELPDQQAQEAERAGLLSANALEEWLRKQLKEQAAAELIAMLDKLDAVDTDEDFSPEAGCPRSRFWDLGFHEPQPASSRIASVRANSSALKPSLLNAGSEKHAAHPHRNQSGESRFYERRTELRQPNNCPFAAKSPWVARRAHG
jgi:hypothetical protein